MGSEPETQSSIQIGFYSVIGALVGGITGSWASTAFSGSAPFDFVSTLLVFGVGGFLGVMAGTAFHGAVKRRYGKRAAKRVEWTGRIGIAAIGLLIIFVAEFVIVLSMEGEFQLPSLPEFVLALAIGALGTLVILIAVRPAMGENQNSE